MMTTPLSTSDLRSLDRAHLWHPFTPMKPWCESIDFPIIARGQREFLFDTDGKQYLDASSSIWCNVHGHCVPEIDAAVTSQLAQVAHTTLLGAGNIPSILLAKRLADLAAASGMNLPRIFYSDNGSTAVEVALKMAFQFWKNLGRPRPKFIAFQNSYHGDTLGAVSVGGIDAFHSTFKPLCFPADFVAIDHAADQIARLLSQNPNPYAAVVIEPIIQGAGGMLLHAHGALRRIRELCDKHNTLLIADEVLTGFGRTGTMFACEREQVSPDLLCLSKGLTAGYMPLGVTMTSEKIFQAFYADPREGKTFFHGHTFTGHPLACAAALASLELFHSSNLLSHVGSLEPILQDLLDRAAKLPFVHAVRRAGLIGAIELRHRDGSPFPYHLRVGGHVCRLMRDLAPIGLLVRPLADVLVIMPPLAIREENLRLLCEGVYGTLKNAEASVERLSRP